MPCKPLPCMIQMQDMPTRGTKRREPRRAPHFGVARLLRPVAARHADYLQTHDAPRQMLLAVGARDARRDHFFRVRVRLLLLMGAGFGARVGRGAGGGHETGQAGASAGYRGDAARAGGE
jgi:hypothetical protein